MQTEEALGGAGPSAPAAAPAEQSEKSRRFFSLFQGVSGSPGDQTSVPENLDLGAVTGSAAAADLPRVGDTAQEKEARADDLARRAAYIEAQGKAERKPSDLQAKAHDRFVATFNDLPQKH